MGLQLRGEKSEKRGADLPAPREPTLPSSGHISLQKAQTPPSRPSPAFQNLPLYSHLFQEALRERETGRRPSLSFNGETDTASQVRQVWGGGAQLPKQRRWRQEGRAPNLEIFPAAYPAPGLTQ